MAPPGLAWLRLFSASTGMALDQAIVHEVKSTVNPLIYTVTTKWAEPITVGQAVQVWNLFQKWAAANESTPSGRVVFDEVRHPLTNEALIRGLTVDVHLRERLGHPKELWP